MKTRITVLAVEIKEFAPRQGQTKGTTQYLCQCIVQPTGADEKPQVGILKIYDRLGVTPEPGEYLAEWGVGVNWDNKEIGGRLVSLQQVPGGSKPGVTASQQRSATVTP